MSQKYPYQKVTNAQIQVAFYFCKKWRSGINKLCNKISIYSFEFQYVKFINRKILFELKEKGQIYFVSYG